MDAHAPQQPDTRHLARPGGRIAYDVIGSGPLVVCVPGMGDLRSSYRFLRPTLVEAGYQVACMDLRGHGESDPTFSSYDPAAAGSDVLALIGELDGPAVVMGSSIGAAGAAWSAAEAPERVRGLVLLGPVVRDAPRGLVVSLLRRLALMWPWGRWAWPSLYARLFQGRQPPDLDEHRERIAESLRGRGRWKAFARTVRAGHRPPQAGLARVRAPTLIVMGSEDPGFPDAAMEADVLAAWLDAEVVMVPEAGHYPHAEFPDLVSAAVLEFLGGLG